MPATPSCYTCIPPQRSRLSHPLTRLDGSPASLLCRSLSHRRRSTGPLPRIPCIYPIRSPLLASSFSFGRIAIHSRVPSPEHSHLLCMRFSLSLSPPPSKYYFSSATNAKLKRISPILSVNMPVQQQYGGQSFSAVLSLPSILLPLSAIHLTSSSRSYVYVYRRSANGYETVAGVATGTMGCFTFPREIASKLRRRCTCAHLATVTLISRLHEYIQMS